MTSLSYPERTTPRCGPATSQEALDGMLQPLEEMLNKQYTILEAKLTDLVHKHFDKSQEEAAMAATAGKPTPLTPTWRTAVTVLRDTRGLGPGT